MKLIFKFFFLFACIIANAQEIVKDNPSLNSKNSEKIELSYLELKRPLNLVQCKNCIDKNPEIDLSEFNKDSELISLYSVLLGNEFIAFDFVIDNYGVVSEVSFNKTYNNNFYTKDKQISFNRILDKFKNKKLINSQFNFDLSIKTTLSFILSNNNLILNPISHK